MSPNTLSEFVARHTTQRSLQERRGTLLTALQDIQEREGYIPDEAIEPLAKALDVSVGDVRGVISFYRELSTTPPGRHTVRVCRGDACAALGANDVVASVEEQLGICPGSVDANGHFTYDIVYCLGNCALSPSVSIDGEVYGRATPERVVRRLEELTGA